MSEQSSVQKTERPHTRDSLAADFRALGVRPGSTLIVHSSLSSLGWVCGGPVAVVQALMDVITQQGTLVMATHSSEYSEPSVWQSPPVPASWWDVIRETMPAFDPRITPTRKMGAIVEAFRVFPGVLRSDHPSSSFAAWGKEAPFITGNHDLDFSLGNASPLARIYELEGHILLLGVGHDSNTSLHLAEARVGGVPVIDQGGPIFEQGKRVWKTYKEFDYDSSTFVEIGEAFECTQPYLNSVIGSAKSRLIRQRELVDFAVEWLRENRSSKVNDSP